MTDIRKLVAAAAVLAVAGALGTVVGVVRGGGDSAAVSLAQSEPEPSPGLPTPSELPTTEPTAAPVPTAVPTLAVPPMPPLPTATVSRPPKPRRPALPPAPGPTSFAAEMDGVKLRVLLDRSSTATAQLVSFRVIADGGRAWLNDATVGYGDSMADQLTSPLLSACAGNDVTHTTDQTVRHAYRLAGTYDFQVVAYARPTTDCSDSSRLVEVKIRGRIVVTQGETRTNGPWPLTADFANEGPQPSTHPYGVIFQGAATDMDGFIREMTLDWGDGKPPYVIRNDMRYCDRLTGPAWPQTWGWATDIAEHVYDEPGDYVVTFRAVSVGCDGRNREDVALRTTVTAKER